MPPLLERILERDTRYLQTCLREEYRCTADERLQRLCSFEHFFLTLEQFVANASSLDIEMDSAVTLPTLIDEARRRRWNRRYIRFLRIAAQGIRFVERQAWRYRKFLGKGDVVLPGRVRRLRLQVEGILFHREHPQAPVRSWTQSPEWQAVLKFRREYGEKWERARKEGRLEELHREEAAQDRQRRKADARRPWIEASRRRKKA